MRNNMTMAAAFALAIQLIGGPPSARAEETADYLLAQHGSADQSVSTSTQEKPLFVSVGMSIDQVTELVGEGIHPPPFNREAEGIVFFNVHVEGFGGGGSKGADARGEAAFEAFFRLPKKTYGFLLGVGLGSTRIDKALNGQTRYGFTNSATVGFGSRDLYWSSRHLGYFKYTWVYDEDMLNYGGQYLFGYRYERDFDPFSDEGRGTDVLWSIGLQGGYEQSNYFRDDGWVLGVTLGVLFSY